MKTNMLAVLLLTGSYSMMSCSVIPFTFVSNNQTWDAAQSYCRSTFTDLATVENEEINQQLVNVSQGNSFWIGLRRNRDNWQWSSGENVTYTNWDRNLFCAFVQSDGSWNDNISRTEMPFMCYNETNNISKRYFWINESLTWSRAQNYCRVNYTDLVSIKNETENQEIMKNAKSFPFWIGLFNNPWKWSDGGNSTFQHWRVDQPDNWNLSEKCVEFSQSDWNDGPCSHQKYFLCYNKSCTSFSCTNTYIFVPYLFSWDDAQKYCRANFTDLVTVENQAMNDHLLTRKRAQNTWIGLRHENDNWHWSNGEPVAYTNWKREFFCAVLQSDGSWNDSVCGEEYPFMCFKETSNISERYSWINLYMTWNKAQQYCRVNYTDLVSIRDESEKMEIMNKAQSNPFWIGLFNDPWKWSDGGQSKFKKWSNQEPNKWSLNEECVEIWPNGTWNDADCSLQKPFICSQSLADKRIKMRVRIDVQSGLNPEDPKISDAILNQVQSPVSDSAMFIRILNYTCIYEFEMVRDKKINASTLSAQPVIERVLVIDSSLQLRE
ncbi:macrophage mannose receptor 1-like [Polypterus senegalus]|uniref:macrophage mannose receptor 1-like n=1 Tax=Polypterus senegalus TaxID=55291 RepID=UPI001963D4A3|nr:macrophage mannose receptor 1-like [Polypterus senegalus]